MLLRKTSKNHKKQAQHVVELSLLLPFFVVLFCYTFQIMIETFSQCRFAYAYMNAIKRTINEQPIFTSISQLSSYNAAQTFDKNIQKNIQDAMEISSGSSPFKNIKTTRIQTEIMAYLVGSFEYNSKTLFFQQGSFWNSYFYFIVPINSAYIEPMALNLNEDKRDSFYHSYYSNYSAKYASVALRAIERALDAVNSANTAASKAQQYADEAKEAADEAEESAKYAPDAEDFAQEAKEASEKAENEARQTKKAADEAKAAYDMAKTYREDAVQYAADAKNASESATEYLNKTIQFTTQAKEAAKNAKAIADAKKEEEEKAKEKEESEDSGGEPAELGSDTDVEDNIGTGD